MKINSTEETIHRLIFSLSELEQLGQTLISGHSNFNVSSKTYLRIALGTLQVPRGAILLYHPSDNQLILAAAQWVAGKGNLLCPEGQRKNTEPATSGALNATSVPPIGVEPDEVHALLKYPVIGLGAPPEELADFFARHTELCLTLGAQHWVPLKIHEEFLGILSLGKFLQPEVTIGLRQNASMHEGIHSEHITDATLLGTYEKLITILAHQISIAIAYSHMVEGIQGEKFRLFMLAESAPQICQLLQPEEAAEQVVHQAVALLDANAGGLLLLDADKRNLSWKYTFPDNSSAHSEAEIPIIGERMEATSKANQSTVSSAEMLARVVKEGKTLHWQTDIDGCLGTKNLMAVPILGRDEDGLGVLVVGDKEERGGRVTAFNDEDAILLDSFAKQGGVAIENARLHQEALEARQLQAEMEEAQKIQENLIPDTLPEIPGYEVAGHYEPRGPVGGDYFDCLKLPAGGWGLAIADVSGKGMQAALLMATLRAGLLSELFRDTPLTTQEKTTQHHRIHTRIPTYEIIEMAYTLNALLYASGTPEKYATFFYSYLNPETDVLTTLNAGHNPPLIVRGDGTCAWLSEDEGGVPLGMFPNDMVTEIAEYEAGQVQLEKGDTVIFYTDGVTETVNIEDEFYDEKRLQQVVKDCNPATATDICQRIYEAVTAFQGEADQFDDLTLLVLRKKP